MADDATTKTSLPMACFHGDGKAELDAERERLYDILALTDEHKQNVVSQIVYALSSMFDSHWSIADVYADMWMRVVIESYPRPGESVSVECDLLEDGLTRLFLYVWDNHKDEV